MKWLKEELEFWKTHLNKETAIKFKQKVITEWEEDPTNTAISCVWGAVSVALIMTFFAFLIYSSQVCEFSPLEHVDHDDKQMHFGIERMNGWQMYWKYGKKYVIVDPKCEKPIAYTSGTPIKPIICEDYDEDAVRLNYIRCEWDIIEGFSKYKIWD